MSKPLKNLFRRIADLFRSNKPTHKVIQSQAPSPKPTIIQRVKRAERGEPVLENTSFYKDKKRVFLGKISGFADKQERAFEQAHLKAYLAGHRLFQFGLMPD